MAWGSHAPSAYAQTGPAGVGNASGTGGQPRNVLWLRADTGVQDVGGAVFQWDDQSGNELNAVAPATREPTLTRNALNGQPGVSFERSPATYLTVEDADALDAAAGVTLLMAVRPRTTGIMVSKRDGPSAVGYEMDVSVDCDALLGLLCLGREYGALGFTIGNDADQFVTSDASNNVAPEVAQLFTGQAQGSNAALYIDTQQRAFRSTLAGGTSTEAALGIGARADGSAGFQGDVAELIVFNEALNQAQRVIIASYMTRKYDIAVATADTVGYAYASSYPQDWAAVGQTTLNGSTHTAANAGQLRVTASSFPSTDDRFAGFAHNGGSTSLGYEATEPVNGAASTIVRMEREWRFDLTANLDAGTKTVTLSLDTADLPALPSGFQPALIVNGDPTFASGSRIYTLQTNGGRYKASVTISDDDVVTLGGVQRLVSIAPTTASDIENAGTPNDLTLQLNHPYPVETGTDVQVTVTAGETGPFGAEGPGPQGSGSDDDDASGNDYNLSNTGAVTISAGATQQPLGVVLHDDAESEQSQQFAVTLASPTNASLGDATATYTVLDDDNPRKVSFQNPVQAVTEGSSGSPREVTFTVELPASFPAATNAPCTSVEVAFSGSSTARIGDVSDPLNDVRLVGESNPGGACPAYQERLSETSARLYFGAGQTTASFKLLINEDNVTDAPAETAVFDLTTPYSSALASSDTQLAVTINDDEGTLPEATFDVASITGEEGTTQTLTVALSTSVSREVSVPFALNTGATDATEGDDFAVQTSSPLTFPAGTTRRTIQVDLPDDDMTELGEQLVLDLGTPSGATLGTPATATLSILDNDRLGATGPAGVGSRESNPLWLRADVLSASNGGAVSIWPDASGNSNDVTATGTAPTFAETGFGGQPSIEFATSSPMEGRFTRNGGLTIFMAGSGPMSGTRPFFEIYDDESGFRHLLEVYAGNVRFGTDTDNDRSLIGLTNPGPEFIDGTGQSGVFSVRQVRDAVEIGSSGIRNTDALDATVRTNRFVLGDDQGGNPDRNPLQNGQIAEVIVYNAPLNDTQRQIVENALSAKYGQALNAGDVYTNSTYTRDVFGIGRTSASDFHVAATQGGLRFDAKSGLNDGEFILAGHNRPYNALQTDDVSSLGPNPARSQRVWYIDVTGSGTVVDLTFDLSEMGLTGQVDDPSQYRLISSNSAPYSWSEVATATEATGDKIIFRDLIASDANDGYYTVLTRDQSIANLDAQSLAINGVADNEAPGTINGGRGGDAGWRMIAAPGTGATVRDLYSLRDDQLVEFGIPDPMFYRWNSSVPTVGDDGPTTGRWNVSNPGDPLVQGRGYMLYVFDNEDPNYEPLDPTLTINANNLTFTDTGTNVTVGDNSSPENTPLASNEEWFVLGNPYPASFELDALNLGQDGDGDGNADFNQNTYVWDPSVNAWILFSAIDPSNNAIAPWQSFFVQRSTFNDTATPGTFAETLTFNSGGTTLGAPFIGSQAEGPVAAPQRALLNLELVYETDASGSGEVRDQTASLLFADDASAARDPYDAAEMMPFATPFVTAAFTAPQGDTRQYGRLSQPWPTEVQTIPLHIGASSDVTGDAVLRVGDWHRIPDTWSIDLIDTQGTAAPADDAVVPLSAASAYSFALNDAAPQYDAQAAARASSTGPPRPTPLSGSGNASLQQTQNASTPPRFRVRVTPETALPVEMAHVHAVAAGQDVRLEWQTASEQNNSGFYVDHQRLAGPDTAAVPDRWSTLGFVEGTGTTNEPQSYRYTATQLDYGRHAFRIRQVDYDGAASIERVQYVDVTLDTPWAVQAPYPNPSHAQSTLEVTVRTPQTVRVVVYDLLGRRVETTFHGELAAQRTRKIVVDTSRLASGTYFVRVEGDAFTATERLSIVR